MTGARELMRAVSWLSAGNLAVRALAFFTMPLLTVWLSPHAYGEAALVATVISLVSVFALAGMDMSYSRCYFASGYGPPEAVEVFSWRLVAGLAALLALVGAALWAFGLAAYFGADPGLAPFVLFGIFASPMFIMAQAHARLRGRYAITSLSLWGVALAAAGIALLTARYWRQDAWPLLLSMVLTYALPLALLGTPSPRRLLAPSGLAPTQRWRILGVGIAGVVTAPAFWILSSADRWFLARSHGTEAVGVYAIGATIGTLGTMFNTAITTAWLPELARLESQGGGPDPRQRADLVQLLFVAMLVVWLAVTAAGGDLIRLLADHRFHGAAEFVPWLAAGVLFNGVMHIGNNLLVMARKLHWAAGAWLIAIVICLAANAWAVPRFGGIGAAMVQALAFFSIAMLVWGVVQRWSPVDLALTKVVGTFGGVGALGAVMAGPWSTSAALSLALKFPIGLAASLVVLRALSPSAWTNLAGRAAHALRRGVGDK